MVQSIIPVIAAAGSIISTALAIPVNPLVVRSVLDRYTFYSGQVTTFPSESYWYSSVDDMLSANSGTMLASCSQFGVSNNSPTEVSEIGSAIKQVAAQTGVDARFILAIVLQESNGCVRAPTTNYGVRNPGLMQSHNGAGTCNDGSVSVPCPDSEIVQMIQDGTAGTSSGAGLQQLIQQATGTGDEKYYQAARMYNSGSIAANGNLNDGIATKCYVNDVANRLTGWVSSQSSCQNGQYVPTSGSLLSSLPLIGGLFGGSNSGSSVVATPASSSSASIASPSSSASASASSSTSRPSVASSTSSAPSRTSSAASSATSVKVVVKNQMVTATNMAPGTTTNCSQFYRVTPGDYCNAIAQKFGVSFTQLRQLNTMIDSNCSNLWLGYDYCIKPST